MTFDGAMLQLDARHGWGFGMELDFDFAGLRGVGMELPVRAEVS